MRIFNMSFQPEHTKVLINDEWYVVSEVHDSRQWIKVHGSNELFQRNHISKFSNKEANNGI